MEKHKLSWASYRDARSIPGLSASSVARMVLGDHSISIPDFRKAKPEPDRAHKYAIELFWNGQTRREFNSDETVIKVGKLKNFHLIIEDGSVSRMHAVFEQTNDGWLLIDLGSTRGTYVNEKRIDRCIIKENDNIRFGDVPYKVMGINLPHASTPAPHVAALAAKPPSLRPDQILPRAPQPVAPPVQEHGHLTVRAPENESRFSIGLSEFKPDGSRFEEIIIPAAALSCHRTRFIKIGKLMSSHAHIDHESVSRMHAVIEFGDKCELIDLGSTRGTAVNGERINRCALDIGDIIHFGDVAFKVTKITLTYSIGLAHTGPDGSVIKESILEEPVIKLGTLASSHFRVLGEKVSRMHAVIEKTDEGYVLIDLGSTHGTTVNGERVNKCVLKADDLIKLGDTTLKVTEINQ